MDSLLLPSRSILPFVSSYKTVRRSTEGERCSVSLRMSCSRVQTCLRASGKVGYQVPGKRRRGLVEANVATEEEVDGFPPPKSESNRIAKSVALLKIAAKTKKVSAPEVCAAFRILEKGNIDPSDFLSIIGGTKSPGRTWLLIFSSGEKEYNSSDGGGKYVPLTAVQLFDAEGSRIENGVYLGPLGELKFTGTFSWEKRKLAFIFHTLTLKIGSLGPFSFSIGSKEKQASKTDPFFIWYYADDEIIVAKGRGGGVAFWVRCTNVRNALI